MRIIHVIDIPWWSGLAAYAMDCVNAQNAMGHEVFILCEKKSLTEKRAVKYGIPHAVIGGRRFWQAPCNFFKLGFYALKHKPDMIVAHTGSTHWMSVLWGKLLGVPVARTRAISQNIKSGFLSRLIYKNTDWVIAASEQLKSDYRNSLKISWAGKLKALLPPAKHPDLEGPGPLVAEVPNNHKIGVLARLDPKKGHFEMLEIMKHLQAEMPDCELHIAGAEENLPWTELSAKAQGMGLKNIWYHGFLEFDQIWDFMKECRMGLIGSLESEEVSRALLEWMSAGRPVVASSVGCIPEILEDGSGGALYSAGNVSEAVQKIRAILKDLTLAQKMGQYNIEVSSRYYSQAQFKSEWHGILYA